MNKIITVVLCLAAFLFVRGICVPIDFEEFPKDSYDAGKFKLYHVGKNCVITLLTKNFKFLLSHEN